MFGFVVSLWNAARDFPRKVWDVVGNAIRHAGDLAQRAVNWVSDRISGVSHWVAQTFSSLYSAIGSIWANIRDLRDNVIGWVVRHIDAVHQAARNFAAWVADQVRRWVDESVIPWLRGAIDWVKHFATVDLPNWIHGRLDDLARALNGLRDWFGDLLASIWRGLEAVGRKLNELRQELTEWVHSRLALIWGWIDRARDFVVGVLRDGAMWFVRRLQEVFDQAPSVLAAALLNTLATHGGTIETFVTRMIGEDRPAGGAALGSIPFPGAAPPGGSPGGGGTTSAVSQIRSGVLAQFASEFEDGRLGNGGVFNCRRINGSTDPDAPWSEHAWGNAWDITVSDKATGDRVVAYLRSAGGLQVGRILWQVARHFDHIHVEGPRINQDGNRVPPCAQA